MIHATIPVRYLVYRCSHCDSRRWHVSRQGMLLSAFVTWAEAYADARRRLGRLR